MQKLFFSLGLIAFSISLGYLIQQLNRRGVIRLPMPIDKMRPIMAKIGILGFIAVAFFLSIWNISITDARLMAFPFVGLGAFALGGGLGLAWSRILGHKGYRTGAMYCCCSFTNLGSLGSLVCIVFLGEQALGLVALYKLLEETYYFTIAFPIAKFLGGSDEAADSVKERLKQVFSDVFVLTIFTAVGLGTLLNVSGIPRPEVCGTISSILVPIGTVIVLTSIGMGLKVSNVRKYLPECLATVLSKFLIIPAVLTGVAWLLGFGDMLGGLPLKVVLVCSSMPVAMIALIPPSLYDLDLDLANSCWLVSTLGLAVVLPVLYFVLQLL